MTGQFGLIAYRIDRDGCEPALGASHSHRHCRAWERPSAYSSEHGRWFRYDLDDGAGYLFWWPDLRHQVVRRRSRWRKGSHRVRRSQGRTNRPRGGGRFVRPCEDRKSTRLNSSHQITSYAVFCLKKKNKKTSIQTSACKIK